jgi:hypothetical protein
MCFYCTMSLTNTNRVDVWADNGVPHAKLTILARPSAETYPNTYVFIFNNALSIDGVSRNVFVDIHYEGDTITPGRSMVAIGGLWIPGIYGAMKPTQHKGELLLQLKAELPSNAPSGGIAGVFGDKTGTQPLPPGLTSTVGASKDLYSPSGWQSSTPKPTWQYKGE